MKIGIIGAAGKAGSAVHARALERGHEATAIVRSRQRAREVLGANARILEKDAFDLSREDLAGFDVVVNAFGTAPDTAYRHVDLAARLVSLLRETDSPRLFFILGAGSLVTGADRHLVVEDIRKAPGSEAWIAIPENQLKQLRYLQGVDNVNWVGVSPAGDFVPGDDQGAVLGKDELLVAADGSSRVATGTLATVILDEIENPRHQRERFTARDK